MYRNTKEPPANVKAPIPEGTQVCQGRCGQAYPLTEEHWHVDKSKPTGFRTMCRQCRSEKNRMRRGKSLLRRIEKLDNAVGRFIGEAAKPGSTVPHVAELYEGFVSAFGGIGGLIQHAMGNYAMMPPGTAGRAAFIRDVIRLGIVTTEAGKADIPLDQLSDEDLQRIQDERLKRLVVHIPPEDINVSRVS